MLSQRQSVSRRLNERRTINGIASAARSRSVFVNWRREVLVGAELGTVNGTVTTCSGMTL